MTYKQVIADLEAKKYLPVYFFTGEEDYYIDFLANYFEENVLSEEVKCFDQQVVYGMDSSMDNILDLAKQYPMLGDKRVLIVKEAQHLQKWDLICTYLENPQLSTLLVFCYKQKKFDKRTKAYKAINQKGLIFERSKLYDSQLPAWIKDYIQERNFEITEKACILIAEALGNDLSKIVNEVSKVFINLKGKKITEEVVEQNIGISKDYNVFELQNALGKRDILKANRIITYFEANPKEHPIQQTIPLLYSFFSKIFIVNQQKEQNPSALAAAIGVSPYFVKDYLEAGKHYSLGKLADIISYLKECDFRSKGIKNASTSDGDLMKELIFKILH